VRHWALLQVQELLEQAAMDQPVLMCLDDLQWADAGTLEALLLLSQQTAGLSIA
jgi:predicted ATPase